MQSEDKQPAFSGENQRNGVGEGSSVNAFRDAPNSRRYPRGGNGGGGNGGYGRGRGGYARRVDNWRQGGGDDGADATQGEGSGDAVGGGGYTQGGRGRGRWPGPRGGRGRYNDRFGRGEDEPRAPREEAGDNGGEETNNDAAAYRDPAQEQQGAYYDAPRNAYRPRRGGGYQRGGGGGNGGRNYRGNANEGEGYRPQYRNRDDYQHEAEAGQEARQDVQAVTAQDTQPTPAAAVLAGTEAGATVSTEGAGDNRGAPYAGTNSTANNDNEDNDNNNRDFYRGGYQRGGYQRGRGRYSEDGGYGNGGYGRRGGRGGGRGGADYHSRDRRYGEDEEAMGDETGERGGWNRRRQGPLQPFDIEGENGGGGRRGPPRRQGGNARAEWEDDAEAARERPQGTAAQTISPTATPPPAGLADPNAAPTAATTGGPRQRVMRAPHLRKNCHDETEILELFEHHHKQTGISLDNYANIPVEMVPRDIMAIEDFQDLAVEPALVANIERCGYKKPTPVQRYGIPVALAGNDLMACAQTGSGKTAAFLIPVVQYILVSGVSPARRGVSYPIALILAPTRELALQIYDEVRKLTFRTDIFYDVVYGGTPYPTRFENDVLVACPGRLKDIFDRGSVSFKAVKFLILDEADRMLEMGFEEQIEYLVASRYTDMPRADERQTLMFSATFPQRILNLAKRYLRKQYYLLTVGRVGSTTKNITQIIEKVPDSEKIDRLFELIYEHKKTDLVLIFVETKKAAEDLHRELNKERIPSSTIHGDRRQQDRERALAEFKSGETPILVATDVAARGLDIPDVSHVIQFDLPTELDDYIHRIGRTGRAGNKGTATCFYNRNNRKLCLDLYRYLTEHEQDIPTWFKQEVEMVEGEALLSRGGTFGRKRDFNSGPSRPRGNDEDNNATWGEAGPSRAVHGRGRGKRAGGGSSYDDGGF